MLGLDNVKILARLGICYIPKGEEKHLSTSIECYLIMGFSLFYSLINTTKCGCNSLVPTLVENPFFATTFSTIVHINQVENYTYNRNLFFATGKFFCNC
jgi:hypothetical protein